MALTFPTSRSADRREARAPDLVLVQPPDDLRRAHHATSGPAIRVVIADGQPVVRAGLHALLSAEKDVIVVGDASDGDEAVAVVERVQPDVVLLDGDISGLDVLDVTRRIVDDSEGAGVRVIVLASDDTDDFLFAALRAGASGFLIKSADPVAHLIEAVRVVAGGSALLSPNATERLIAEFASQPQPHLPSHQQLEELTPREREVMALVATGLSTDQIAEQLVISRATVKTHVSRALTKLDMRDRAQLVAAAYQVGLVQPSHRRTVQPVALPRTAMAVA